MTTLVRYKVVSYYHVFSVMIKMLNYHFTQDFQTYVKKTKSTYITAEKLTNLALTSSIEFDAFKIA